MCAYTYIHIYIYTHICIHIYIYIYITYLAADKWGQHSWGRCTRVMNFDRLGGEGLDLQHPLYYAIIYNSILHYAALNHSIHIYIYIYVYIYIMCEHNNDHTRKCSYHFQY